MGGHFFTFGKDFEKDRPKDGTEVGGMVAEKGEVGVVVVKPIILFSIGGTTCFPFLFSILQKQSVNGWE